jgi:glucose 1-dehydrogenase
MKLKGKTAIVTGSDSGIGKAIALAFAREGANIAVTYMTDKQGAMDTKERARKLGSKVIVLRLDHTDSASVKAVYDQTVKELGIPTILVNNAGGGHGDPVRDMSDETWDEIIKKNLYGPFYFSREFIRGMEKVKGPGKIINITSVHEDIPAYGGAAYCAAKAGLRNLTRVLTLELAEKKINVNNIAPGMILTPMNQKAIDDPEHRKKQTSNIPVKRAGTPEEIAEAAVFLASEESNFVHGESLFIDGGQRWYLGQGA